MPYYVYILECSDGTYYCGVTKNLEQRIAVHNSGRGAKYTRSRRPVKAVYFEHKRTLRQAMRREREIKSFSRKKKKEIIFLTP